jgi:hypothetical protein
MCEVAGCHSRPVAKGFCAKHYKRLRRHGDPHIKNKPGQQDDEITQMVVENFGYMSPRSRGTAMRAIRILDAIQLATGGNEVIVKALKASSRANGMVNATRLRKLALLARENYWDEIERSPEANLNAPDESV